LAVGDGSVSSVPADESSRSDRSVNAQRDRLAGGLFGLLMAARSSSVLEQIVARWR
jgi:hypothetical protein